MSAHLLQAVLDQVRASFSRAELAEVRTYAGEFNGEEIDQVPVNCPAVLVTCLGWKPEHGGRYVAGRTAQQVRMAAFIVTRHVERDKALTQAMAVAEKLCWMLRLWAPDSTGLPVDIGPLDDAPRAENLYGRAVDKKGLALWLVDWQQCVRPVVPLPRLYDLLAIEIIDHTQQGVAPGASAPLGQPPTVTEDVQFDLLPPAV